MHYITVLKFLINTQAFRHVSTLSCVSSSGSATQCLYKTFYITFYKNFCTLPEDGLQERVETCRSCSVFIVKILYRVSVPNLVYS